MNLPTVSSILKFIVGADRGAERAENQVEWSGAVCRSYRKTMERNGARSGSRSGASQKSGGVEQSSKQELQKNDGAERSAEQEVAERCLITQK